MPALSIVYKPKLISKHSNKRVVLLKEYHTRILQNYVVKKCPLHRGGYIPCKRYKFPYKTIKHQSLHKVIFFSSSTHQKTPWKKSQPCQESPSSKKLSRKTSPWSSTPPWKKASSRKESSQPSRRKSR